MNSKQRLKLRVVGIAIICAAGVLISSLYFTQIVNGPTYAAKADQQYVKPAVTLFDRGAIYLQSKDSIRVAGATVAEGYLVFMNPSIMTSPEQSYQILSQYIKLDHDDFLRRASKVGDRYEELAHRVNADVAQSINSLGIVGLGTSKETWRSYPMAEVSSQTIGLIGQSKSATTTEQSNIIGRYGLERTYEEVLSRPSIGSNGNMFAQIFSGLGNTLVGSGVKNKGNIISSLEPTVSAFVQKTLEKTISEWNPDEIGGIVMDPNTGEIFAAVSLPSFNPNDTSKVRDVSIFSNPLVENVYEMGSIMKPLTMSVGIDTGAIRSDSTYDDLGTMILNGKKISNFDGKARGVIPSSRY